MLLRSIAEEHKLHSNLLDDPFWSLDSTRVTGDQVALFYARNRTRIGEAGDLIDRLQTALITMAVQGGKLLASADLLQHEPPDDPFFLDEFLDRLRDVPRERQMAIVFALEAGVEPYVASELTWRKARDMRGLNRVATSILELCASVRHVRLPYVFWEWATPTIAAPLIDLEGTVKERFEAPWPKIARQYRGMVMVGEAPA